MYYVDLFKVLERIDEFYSVIWSPLDYLISKGIQHSISNSGLRFACLDFGSPQYSNELNFFKTASLSISQSTFLFSCNEEILELSDEEIFESSIIGELNKNALICAFKQSKLSKKYFMLEVPKSTEVLNYFINSITEDIKIYEESGVKSTGVLTPTQRSNE